MADGISTYAGLQDSARIHHEHTKGGGEPGVGEGVMASATPESVAPEPVRTPDVDLLRLVNLGGALVTASHLGIPEPLWSHAGRGRFCWQCRGCGEREVKEHDFTVKDKAREHAETCRSVPPTDDDAAPPSAGQVLVAEAISELTRELGDQIADLRDELCTEVAELAAEFAAQHRRRPFWRRLRPRGSERR